MSDKNMEYRREKVFWLLRLLTVLIVTAVISVPGLSLAGMKSPPPKKIDAVFIGDRLVDIAFNLGVVPKAMSVRGSLWPMAAKLKTSSQIIGCPMHTTVKNKEAIPNALKKFGVKRVIVEKSNPFCMYKKEVNLETVSTLVKGMDVTVEYVDFTKGLEAAVRQIASLLGKEERADKVIALYNKRLAAAKKKLPEKPLGKKVIIFNGTYQASTGKTMLRVEAPGGYSDQFLLKPLGCVNAGDAFNSQGKKPSKGHFAVRKKKGGLVLDPLITANPDVILITGDVFAVQKALADFKKVNGKLAEVTAIRDMAVYGVPLYVDSGVLEYPGILTKWTSALSQ